MRNEAPLQSTSSALAGSARDIMEPVSGIIEKTWPVRRTLSIAAYRSADRQDALVVLVTDVIRELGAERAVRLHVRSWMFWWFVLLLKGVSHPPVLEIDGKVYSQGIVPEREKLKIYLRSLLIG